MGAFTDREKFAFPGENLSKGRRKTINCNENILLLTIAKIS